MKRSLHIGINDYPGTANDLFGCVNDAMDWSKAMKDRGFDDQVVLLDDKATKKAMYGAIDKIVSDTGRDDIAVITYSGHGTWIPDEDGDEADGRDECLCPWDIGTTGEVLSDDELYEVFGDRKRGARIIFISDSCHSGTVSRMALQDDEPFKNDSLILPRAKFMAPSFYMTPEGLQSSYKAERAKARKKIKAATVLLSGCKDNEYSYDAYFNQRPNGAMTYVALWCLERLKPENTYYDWFKMIRQYLPHQSYPQTPQLSCSYAQRKWSLFNEME